MPSKIPTQDRTNDADRAGEEGHDEYGVDACWEQKSLMQLCMVVLSRVDALFYLFEHSIREICQCEPSATKKIIKGFFFLSLGILASFIHLSPITTHSINDFVFPLHDPQHFQQHCCG